ncbi:MAG: hypothetical protein WC346_01250 [Methanogenium sp.]
MKPKDSDYSTDSVKDCSTKMEKQMMKQKESSMTKGFEMGCSSLKAKQTEMVMKLRVTEDYLRQPLGENHLKSVSSMKP